MPLEEMEQLGRAVIFWNERLGYIVEQIEASDDKNAATFKWGQLVWQEVVMYIGLGTVEDFQWLCKRRGFDAPQRKILREVLEHVGLEVSGA